METQRYLYETHMHTSEASACAGSTGAQMARAYKEAGYTGIIVTDHFFMEILRWTVPCRGRSGYGASVSDMSMQRQRGERIGLSVFFGWEACYEGTEFLVYGLDQAWLLAHPQIKDASIRSSTHWCMRAAAS